LLTQKCLFRVSPRGSRKNFEICKQQVLQLSKYPGYENPAIEMAIFKKKKFSKTKNTSLKES